jgi:hypothetical protein
MAVVMPLPAVIARAMTIGALGGLIVVPLLALTAGLLAGNRASRQTSDTGLSKLNVQCTRL